MVLMVPLSEEAHLHTRYVLYAIYTWSVTRTETEAITNAGRNADRRRNMTFTS